MASQPSATQKSSSRWGSFLAGVESRLDTIWADEETAKVAARNRQDGGTQEQPGMKDVMAVPSPGPPTRTASANRAQDRLNEKLAKAMANRNLAKKPDASVTTSGIPSRTNSPANTPASPRASSDLQRESTISEKAKSNDEKSLDIQSTTNGIEAHEEAKDNNSEAFQSNAEPAASSPAIAVEEVKDETDAPRPSTESRGSISTRQSLELTRATTPSVAESPNLNGIVAEPSTKLPEEYEKTLELMRSDNEAAELRRQEETHTYLEQIDALQAKLKYLTKEAAEIAKNVSAEAKPGSLEHKVASKDEQIALLIEEGQKLSQTELKHTSIIKRLRAKGTEDEKVVADSKRAAERQEKAARDAREKANRAESAEKRASDRVKFLSRVEKDLETVKADRDSKNSLIQDLQFQLSQATSAAKEAEAQANAEALESERKRAADLADELSNLKTERDLVEKQNQNELCELRETAEREKERARVTEIERSREQNILESRLEAYRARFEEASVGQGGDVQAKLLRQIETLQNQYAVASENWQGIEGSLLARVSALEKERDDVSKREVDMRRKARETVSFSIQNLEIHALTYNRTPRPDAWKKRSKGSTPKHRTWTMSSHFVVLSSAHFKKDSTNPKPTLQPPETISRLSVKRGKLVKLNKMKRLVSETRPHDPPQTLFINSSAPSRLPHTTVPGHANLPMQTVTARITSSRAYVSQAQNLHRKSDH